MSKSLPVIWHDQRNNELYKWGTCNATSIAIVMQYKNKIPADYDKSAPLQFYINKYQPIFTMKDEDGIIGKGTQLDDYVTIQLATPTAWEVHKKTLPDWRNYNPRNNPFVLQWYLESVGIKDEFYQVSKENDKSALYRDGQKIMSGNIEILSNIRASIDRDMPVIMAGNYTRKRVNGTQDVITHINVAVGYDDNNIIVNDPFGSMLNYYLPYPNDGDHVVVPNEFLKEHVTQLHILSV